MCTMYANNEEIDTGSDILLSVQFVSVSVHVSIGSD